MGKFIKDPIFCLLETGNRFCEYGILQPLSFISKDE